MARPMTPLPVAEMLGRTDVNPARYDGRQARRRKSEPLGPPPEGLNLLEIAIWCEIAATLWWLTADHRMPAEILCRLMARMREGDTSSEVVNGAMRCCKMLGADSSSGARIIAGQDDEDAEDMF